MHLPSDVADLEPSHAGSFGATVAIYPRTQSSLAGQLLPYWYVAILSTHRGDESRYILWNTTSFHCLFLDLRLRLHNDPTGYK